MRHGKPDGRMGSAARRHPLGGPGAKIRRTRPRPPLGAHRTPCDHPLHGCAQRPGWKTCHVVWPWEGPAPLQGAPHYPTLGYVPRISMLRPGKQVAGGGELEAAPAHTCPYEEVQRIDTAGETRRQGQFIVLFLYTCTQYGITGRVSSINRRPVMQWGAGLPKDQPCCVDAGRSARMMRLGPCLACVLCPFHRWTVVVAARPPPLGMAVGGCVQRPVRRRPCAPRWDLPGSPTPACPASLHDEARQGMPGSELCAQAQALGARQWRGMHQRRGAVPSLPTPPRRLAP